MMYKGWLDAKIEVLPLTFTSIPPPGLPEFLFTFTPAAAPCRAVSKLGNGKSSIFPGWIEDTAPVRFFLFCVE